MKNERWITTIKDYLVREGEACPCINKSDEAPYPYTRRQGFFLEGYHAAIKKRLHTYGPFDTVGEMEAFAREHHIDLGAQG